MRSHTPSNVTDNLTHNITVKSLPHPLPSPPAMPMSRCALPSFCGHIRPMPRPIYAEHIPHWNGLKMTPEGVHAQRSTQGGGAQELLIEMLYVRLCVRLVVTLVVMLF